VQLNALHVIQSNRQKAKLRPPAALYATVWRYQQLRARSSCAGRSPAETTDAFGTELGVGDRFSLREIETIATVA
jgi:hypothetical protein